jgi:hypothetical protein
MLYGWSGAAMLGRVFREDARVRVACPGKRSTVVG